MIEFIISQTLGKISLVLSGRAHHYMHRSLPNYNDVNCNQFNINDNIYKHWGNHAKRTNNRKHA